MLVDLLCGRIKRQLNMYQGGFFCFILFFGGLFLVFCIDLCLTGKKSKLIFLKILRDHTR